MVAKSKLSKPRKPAWKLADYGIPETEGLRGMHVDPTKVTIEEAKADPVARKVVEIGAIMTIFYELSDVTQAGPHADRWDYEEYSKRREEDGRSPFLRFSSRKGLIKSIDATFPRYIESIGVSGNFRYGQGTFMADVIYDFANRQPTKVTASLLLGGDGGRAKKAIKGLPNLIMPEGKFHLSQISIEQIERLGDYTERKRALQAAVLRGHIKYGGQGKPMYEAWMGIIDRANSSKRFDVSKFYLRVNDSFKHHNKATG